MIGHNHGPDIDGQPKQQSIRTRWVKALLADAAAPSYVMAMVTPIHWFSRNDGTGAAISNQQFKVFSGISEDTCTRGKKWLRDNGYIQLIMGKQHQKTQFRLTLPEIQPPLTADPEIQHPLHQGPQSQDPATADPQHPLRADLIQERDSRSKKGSGANFWKQALNPEPDYHVNPDGTVVLVNGVRSRWLLEFGDDPKRLDLALKQISAYVQPNSTKGLAMQVESQLARIAAEKHDRDGRYNKRVAEAPVENTNKSRRERMRQSMEEEAAKLQAGRRK